MRLRIRGLVKTMNLVRQRLAVGLEPDEVDQLRATVVRALRSVEAACRHYCTPPEALPTPSLRAYRFLKSIDLQSLPIRDPEQPQTEPRPAQIRIKNLIHVCERLHHKMELLAAGTQKDADLLLARTAALRSVITDNVARVEVLCRNQGGTPMQMPQRSRKAYLWLNLLQTHELLELHLTALAQAVSAATAFCNRQGRDMAVSLRFFNIPHLYRSSTRHGCLQVTINEAFIGAPIEVIQALVQAALGDRSPAHLHRLRAYADSKSFTRLALVLSDDDHEQSTRGSYHDLADSFARVNQTYFDGRLTAPRLTWSKTFTKRKLGHYRPSTDTVMISRSVDTPAAPDYVIDFLMYHELLHRVLGIKEINGRRRIHTPRFRAEEKRFKQYEQAEAALQKLTE